MEYLAARTVGKRKKGECKDSYSCPASTSSLTNLAKVMQVVVSDVDVLKSQIA